LRTSYDLAGAMRNVRLASLLLLLPFWAHAQQPVDSLWTVWKNTTAPDTSRLSAIHALSKEVFLYSDPDSAFALAQVQLNEAQRVGNVSYAGEALNTQGIALAMRGKMDDALAHFERSLKVFEDGGDRSGMASALYNIGNFYMRRGEPEKGLDYMQRTLRISEETGNVRSMTRCYHGIGRYHEQRGEYDEALRYYTKSLETFRANADDRGVIGALISIGVVHKSRGDYERAIATLGEALTLAEAKQDAVSVGSCLDNIGNLHARQGDHAKAREYYERALVHAEGSSDKEGAMQSLMNLGNASSDLHENEQAIAYFNRSLDLARSIGDKKTEAIILNNLCTVYSELGEVDKALDHCQRGLALKREVGFTKGVSNSLANIGTVLIRAGRYREAKPYSEEALELAREAGNAPEVRDVALDLSHIYRALHEPERSLALYELHVQMKDSIDRDENQRAVLRQEFKYNYEKQALADSLVSVQRQRASAELLQKERDRRNLLMVAGLVAIAFGAVSYRQRRRTQKALVRSDELLLNILPEEVAEELKEKGEAEAKQIENVTVLFTDFKGFTAMSERLTPKELVRDIHECFSAFDRICTKHGIEKIKTIGDAYMAAGGIPTPNTTHALDVVKAALEIRDFIEEGKARKISEGKPYFEIRIGVHTGPVVAGIVGVKKFAYDIWGDTVNTASRMESSGEVGQVNISEATYALLKDVVEDDVASTHRVDPNHVEGNDQRKRPAFTFTPRGKVQAKGKGEMEMYFVENA